MKKISEKIIEKNIHTLIANKKRTTARAIIINEKKEILMLYSQMFNDYTFPGGGVGDDEDLIDALKREVLEETGIVLKNIKHYGYIEEIRYGISGSDNVYDQTSHYYLAEVESQREPNLIFREKIQGLKAVYVEPTVVLEHNKKVRLDKNHQIKGLKTVLIRENKVIQSLIDEGLL